MAGGSQDRGTFPGIARTLLALALLAERAAGRSFPVRFLVVAILGRAVAVARAYVAREIGAEGWCLDLAFPDEPPAMRFAAAGADILALRLRLLAAVLGALADTGAASAGLSDGRPAGRPEGVSFHGSAGHFADRAPLANGVTHLALLLVVCVPSTRRCRLPDTS
ncbi:MAG TPA: hypothetical protein GX405_06530 [Rhizobiales bacterium]|nr:hypothetical protein [Hyphomicrobiales bacterium]